MFESEMSDGEGQEAHGQAWSFVTSNWFQYLTAGVILLNIAFIFVENDSPDLGQYLKYPDQALLVFYVFELYARINYYGRKSFFKASQKLAWNVLDLVVVMAGVVDTWIIPLLGVEAGGPVGGVLKTLRMLRIVRVLKIVRIFLESDLSWTEAPKFQSAIGVVIAFNSLLMGLETDIEWHGWFYVEQVLLLIYTFELAVVLKRLGFSFFHCSNPDITWNLLDFVIVVSSVLDSWILPMVSKVIEILSFSNRGPDPPKKGGMSLGQVMMLMRMLRLMRILRLLKLIKAVRPLYVLVTGVLAALQGVVWCLLLTLMVLYAMGIVTTRLVGHGLLLPEGKDLSGIKSPFATVPDSMFTLFRVMSGAESDDEAGAIDELMMAVPTIKFVFVFFMITSSWTLLSILTAVVSENMISTTGEQENDLKLQSAEKEREMHIAQLTELFKSIDMANDGMLDEVDFLNFLQDEENAIKTARICKVPTRSVVDVLRALNSGGEPVGMQRFVECLAEVGNPTTEKSTLVLEARLLVMERRIDTHFEALYRDLDLRRGEKDEGPSQSCLAKRTAARKGTADAGGPSTVGEVAQVLTAARSLSLRKCKDRDSGKEPLMKSASLEGMTETERIQVVKMVKHHRRQSQMSGGGEEPSPPGTNRQSQMSGRGEEPSPQGNHSSDEDHRQSANPSASRRPSSKGSKDSSLLSPVLSPRAQRALQSHGHEGTIAKAMDRLSNRLSGQIAYLEESMRRQLGGRGALQAAAGAAEGPERAFARRETPNFEGASPPEPPSRGTSKSRSISPSSPDLSRTPLHSCRSLQGPPQPRAPPPPHDHGCLLIRGQRLSRRSSTVPSAPRYR